MSPLDDGHGINRYATSQLQIQQELDKLEAAIERLLLEDPDQINISSRVEQLQHLDEQLDKSGESFLSGVRRKSGLDKLMPIAKKSNTKTEKEEIIAKIKRLQAVCEEMKVSGASLRSEACDEETPSDHTDVGQLSLTMTSMKEPSLEAATFDIEAIVPASRTMEDVAQDFKSTGAYTTTMKSVVAYQEILSATTFSPQDEIEVSLYSAKLETQLVKYRRNIPLVLTLPDDESKENSFKDQVAIIYNAFRLQSEKRTKLKHAVFSWLLKNGMSFYAQSTPEDRFARRKRGPKWVKKMGALSEHEILEAGLRVVKKRVKAIRQSLRIQNDRQRMHFKTVLLSWLRQLENADEEKKTEATKLLKAPSQVDPSQMEKPESIVKTYSTKDDEGSPLLSGLELLNTDSALRVNELENDPDQTKKAEADELDINDRGSNNFVQTMNSTGFSMVQEPTIDVPVGCNLFYGLFVNSLELCQSSTDGETNTIVNESKRVLNAERLGGDRPSQSDLELLQPETTSERKNDHKVNGSQLSTQQHYFTTKDDEGDMALVNALVELLSQEQSEVHDAIKKLNSDKSVSDSTRNGNSKTILPEIDAPLITPPSPKDFVDNLGGVASDDTNRQPVYINSTTTSCETDEKCRTTTDEDPVEYSHQKQTSMIKSMVYKRSFKATVEKPSGEKVNAIKTPKAAKLRGRSPPIVIEAMGMNNEMCCEQVPTTIATAKKCEGNVGSIEESDAKGAEPVPLLDESSDNASANAESSRTLPAKTEFSSTLDDSVDHDGRVQKEDSKKTTIDDVPTGQPTLMILKSTRTERLRQTKKKSQEKTTKVKEQNGTTASAVLSKETPSGKLPARTTQRLWKKENADVANQRLSLNNVDGQKTKNLSTDQKDKQDKSPLTTTGTTSDVGDDPPKKYGQSSNRKSRKARSRRFQPQLSTHYEATASKGGGSEMSSDGHDEETCCSHEDDIPARGNDYGTSVISEFDDAFPKVASELVDSFDKLRAAFSDSSLDSLNLFDQGGSPLEESVLSSLALLLNRFQGNSGSNDSIELYDEHLEYDVEDESVYSDDDASDDSETESFDLDDEEAEMHVKQRSSHTDSKKTRSNRIEDDLPKNTENNWNRRYNNNGFFLSNRTFGRRHRRHLHQPSNVPPLQFNPLPNEEEDTTKEDKKKLSSHRRKPLPLMIDASENPEIEVGRVLTRDSFPHEKSIGMDPETSSLQTRSIPYTNSSKKGWYFLSRRKSERQQHNSRSISNGNPSVQGLDDSMDDGYSNESRNDGESEEAVLDCRDDAESHSSGRYRY
jgi:hypothetical protein